MRLLFVFLYFGPLVCGQRAIYNSDLDQTSQAAAAAAKLLSSDSAAAKAIANQAIIEKQEIETALEASLNTMRLQIQSFDRWSNVFAALGDVTAEIQTLKAFTPLTAELSSRQSGIRASALELQKAVIAKQKKEDKSETAFVDQAVASIGDASALLGLATEIPGSRNIAGLKALNEVEDGLGEINDLLVSAAAAIKAAKDVRADPRSLMPSQEELMLSVLAAEMDSLKERIAIRVGPTSRRETRWRRSKTPGI
jgi:NAD/FAD-utilizing enzyme apparently involved in cell division